jgi:hypothetical protein
MAGRISGPVFGGADVHQNLTDLTMHPIPSDDGSLLGADLAAMPGGGDEHAQVVYDLAHAHASAADAVRSARSAYPAVTAISDMGDALTGAAAQAGRAAIRGAAAGAVAALSGRHPNPFKTEHVPPAEETGRAARDALRPF